MDSKIKWKDEKKREEKRKEERRKYTLEVLHTVIIYVRVGSRSGYTFDGVAGWVVACVSLISQYMQCAISFKVMIEPFLFSPNHAVTLPIPIPNHKPDTQSEKLRSKGGGGT